MYPAFSHVLRAGAWPGSPPVQVEASVTPAPLHPGGRELRQRRTDVPALAFGVDRQQLDRTRAAFGFQHHGNEPDDPRPVLGDPDMRLALGAGRLDLSAGTYASPGTGGRRPPVPSLRQSSRRRVPRRGGRGRPPGRGPVPRTDGPVSASLVARSLPRIRPDRRASCVIPWPHDRKVRGSAQRISARTPPEYGLREALPAVLVEDPAPPPFLRRLLRRHGWAVRDLWWQVPHRLREFTARTTGSSGWTALSACSDLPDLPDLPGLPGLPDLLDWRNELPALPVTVTVPCPHGRTLRVGDVVPACARDDFSRCGASLQRRRLRGRNTHGSAAAGPEFLHLQRRDRGR